MLLHPQEQMKMMSLFSTQSSQVSTKCSAELSSTIDRLCLSSSCSFRLYIKASRASSSIEGHGMEVINRGGCTSPLHLHHLLPPPFILHRRRRRRQFSVLRLWLPDQVGTTLERCC